MIRWLGRVCLWLIFWPVGLWRSARHSGEKAGKRAARREIRKAEERSR